MSVIVIVYTTRYRDGGRRFAQVARTMAAHARRSDPHARVVCTATETKDDLREVFDGIERGGQQIEAFHFVGHSGLYGPMFGTTAWPEQFSPHEWRTQSIPFAQGAHAQFHSCRSARWFAPFFARTFGVRTLGYHWYTAFSRDPQTFRPPPPWLSSHAPLFVGGCPGRKSHGIGASVRKYAGVMPMETARVFDPATAEASYDPVAEAYDGVFDDIGVRAMELRWLQDHLPAAPCDVLDIGCGNGALLQKLAPRLRSGLGVDASPRMVELAQHRCRSLPTLEFAHVRGPQIPAADNSVDVVTSLLSFRYLDWDPLMRELQRVLRPGGKLLVVDMVDRPVTARELPRVVRDKVEVLLHERAHPEYRARRAAMVRSDAWAQMVRYNPMRAFHEYDWYLHSRFPAGSLETLNVGRRARVIAFDSGRFDQAEIAEQAYP